MYERLEEVLRDLNDKIVNIDKAYIVTVGAIKLSYFDENSSSTLPITNLKNSSVKSNISDLKDFGELNIESILKQHKNIFNINKIKDRKLVLSPHKLGILFESNIFSVHIDLPKRFQYYSKLYSDSKDPIEHFDTIVRGSVFASYSKIIDYPVNTFIGNEFRDIYKSQIENETKFKAPALGPSPIHPRIYIITTKSDYYNKINIYEYMESIFLVIPCDTFKGVEYSVNILLDQIESELIQYYFCKICNSLCILYSVEIENRFEELSSIFRGLLNDNWWNIFSRINNINKSKRIISNLNIQYVEHEQNILQFNREREKILDDIDNNLILSKISNYFKETSESVGIVPKSLPDTVSYFDKYIKNFFNIYTILLASIIGAILGAILTALLS